MAQSLESLIEELVRVLYQNTIRLTVSRQNTPDDMIEESDQGLSEWVKWKIIERSSDVVPEFTAFEAEIGHQLPYSFKYWHSRYYHLESDWSFIYMPKMPTNDPFSDIRDRMINKNLPDKYIKKGYLPFGSIVDAGPLCFYTAADVDNHDYPIYLWDHDAMSSKTWSDEDAPENDLFLVFSNFRKLIECTIHSWGGKLDDYPDIKPKYLGFKTIDPDGAGTYFNR